MYPAWKNQFSNQTKNFLYFHILLLLLFLYFILSKNFLYLYFWFFSILQEDLDTINKLFFWTLFWIFSWWIFWHFFYMKLSYICFFFGFFLVFLITLFVFTKINIRNFFTLFILLIHSFYNNSINFSKRSRKKVHSNPHLYILH